MKVFSQIFWLKRLSFSKFLNFFSVLFGKQKSMKDSLIECTLMRKMRRRRQGQKKPTPIVLKSRNEMAILKKMSASLCGKTSLKSTSRVLRFNPLRVPKLDFSFESNPKSFNLDTKPFNLSDRMVFQS